MVILSKVLSAFLLPPGLFVVLLGVLAWMLRPQSKDPVVGKVKKTFPFLLACGGAVLLYLLSIDALADVLLKPLEDRYPPLPRLVAQKTPKEWEQVDAVVVLGGGTVNRSPEKGLDDLREESLKRLLYGVRIYREVKRDWTPKLLLILSGGKVFDVGQDAEAAIMGRYAAEWGVEPGSILLEPDSRTTWENALHVATRFRPRRILLVTSAYHMPRAVWCFTRQGIEVIPAPTGYKVDRGVPYDLESFLPTLDGFQNARRALREYLGSLQYGIVYR